MQIQCLGTMLVIFAFFATAEADYITLSGRTFGTSYMVKVIGDEPIDAEALDATIHARFDEIDARMSTYRDDSEVSQFNNQPVGEWFPVSEETAQLVQRAAELSQQTNGAFDITVGPAVALWQFGAGAGEGEFQVPSDEAIAATLQRIGYSKLEIRLDPPALKKNVAGLEVDLSAIAKGYAVDAIAGLLEPYPNYMVEIGGEVRTKGSRDLGTGWRIGLEAPTTDERRVDSVMTLRDESLATSGDYRNFHVHQGVTYSHTIDPTTARPVTHALASATVMAEDCATADALATALLVMGPTKGKAFAEQHGIRALLVSRDGDDLLRVATQGFTTNDPSSSAGYLTTFLVTASVFGLAVLAMSVGTIIANRRLQGSCGGMAGLKDKGGNTICDMCTKPSPECSGEPEAS